MIAGFERKVLFRVARFVALSICMALFLVMAGGLLFLASSMSSSEKPDPAAVIEGLKPTASPIPGHQRGSEQPALEQQSVLSGLRVDPQLQAVMDRGNNEGVIEGWVTSLDPADRQPFVSGLGEALREASKHDVDDADALNTYHEHFRAYVLEREASKLASFEAKLYTAGAVVSVLLLLALFSLVLVLLAIERNTYRAAGWRH